MVTYRVSPHSYKKWLLSSIDDGMESQILVAKALPAENKKNYLYQ